MPLPRSLSLFVALLVVSAYAQPARELPEPPRAEPREPSPDAHAQQRRAMLRASLRVQLDSSSLAREAPLPSARLLSDQERAELRQQLRQQ